MQKQTGQPVQRRETARQRTRLRSGKVAGIGGNFLVDCQIFDRSPKGVRLRLAEPIKLPDHIRLFDDEYATLSVANIVWVDGQDVGIEFLQGPGSVERDGKEHAALEGRYYDLKK